MGSSDARAPLTPATLHILLSLAQADRHGYAVRQDVEARTSGDLRLGPGTLYEALHRMLGAGWVDVVAEPVERRRKVYRLTPAGQAELATELERLDAIVQFARASKLLPDPGSHA